MRLSTLLAPRTTAYAHCALPCGVYDPAQARLEAESVKACMVKYHGSDDPDFKARAISIKEERSNMVKEHLWVLWTDYFKAPHFEKYPQLNGLFNEATKLAGAGGTKGTVDVAVVPLKELGERVPMVNLEIIEPGPESNAITMRVHERGAGITQACGTGACASAWAAVQWGLVSGKANDVVVHMDGGDVRVRVNDPAPGRVTLIGPSEHLLSTTAVLHA